MQNITRNKMRNILLKSWRRVTLTGLVLVLALLTLSVNQSSVQAIDSFTQTEDTTPPQLQSLTLNRTSVDSTNSQQFVLLTARVTDDSSGTPFNFGISFRSASGSILSGGFERDPAVDPNDPLNTIYRGLIAVPQFGESGTYQIQNLSVTDRAQNTRIYTQAQLAALGVPTALEVISISDVTPPQLAAFNFASSTVDATRRTQIVLFSARVTDDLSGYPYNFGVDFRSASGRILSGNLQRDPEVDPNDPLNTVYRGILYVPQGTELGIYQIQNFNLTDRADNTRTYTQAQLSTLGFPTTIEVTTIPDVTPPQLVEFNFTPSFIRGEQLVSLTGRVTDDLSGVPLNLSFAFTSPSGQVINSGLNVISPGPGTTILDKQYQGGRFVSSASEPGIYELQSFELSDRIGNVRTYTQAELAALGFPTKLYVNVPPPAANSIISGKVLDQRGRGVSGAMVTSTDSNGRLRYAMTNPFGRYRFNNLTMGDTHTLRIRHKRLTFTPQTLTITAQSHNIDLIAR